MHQAFHEDEIIHLVDPVLVREQVVGPPEPVRDTPGERRSLHVHHVREPDACKGDENREDHQPSLEAVAPRASVRYVRKDRSEKITEQVRVRDDRSRHTDPADGNSEEREDDERDGHDLRRFMDVVVHLRIDARFAVECQVDQAERIKGRQERSRDTEQPERPSEA